MNKKNFLLILIIAFAFFIRAYKISRIPAGFYSDEAVNGYEAYSILKTGRDQYGSFLPVTFKANGDYRPGLFIYSTVPFIAIFGLEPAAVRLPAVFFSTLTVIFIYLLACQLFNNSKIGLLSAFMFTISPWSIQFARMSHETNLATLLILISLYFYIRFLRSQRPVLLIISLIISTISAYAYYTTRLFVPIFWILQIMSGWKKIIIHTKQLAISIFLCLILSLPLLFTLTNAETGWSRINAISLWGDSGIKNRTNEYRHEDKLSEGGYSVIFHNKYIDGGQEFIKSWLSHFDPKFLVIRGEFNEIYNTPGNGIFLYIEFILIITGVYYLIRNQFAYNKLFFIWLFIGLLPDTLTRLAPAAARIHLLLPLSTLVSGYGLAEIYLRVNSRGLLQKFIFATGCLLLAFNFTYFLHANFVHVQVRYARQWHYGLEQLVKEVALREKDYDNIWVSKKAWGWINFLFFLKYPPELVQKEIILSPRNEYGFGWVYKIGKYTFDDFPSKFDINQKILLVGSPEEFSKNINPDVVIYYPDKSPAFYVINSREFAKNL